MTKTEITKAEAQNAMALINILKRPRAKKLDAGDAEHMAAILGYVRLGVPSATEDDARRALEIVKSPITKDDLWNIATR